MFRRTMQNLIKVAAFDFDNTLINTNSDTYIDRLLTPLENRSFDYVHKYPKDIDGLTHTHGWTVRMNAVFKHLFDNQITKNDILDCIREIEIDRSIINFVKCLKNQQNYELIIISDANSIFIEEILRANQIEHLFQKIYTNPAYFDENGCLRVNPLNETINENGVEFDCETKCCAKNLCKGYVFNKHLKERQDVEGYEKMIFVGDGYNDYCGGLNLRLNDHFLVRKGFSLDRLLLKNDKQFLNKLKANVLYWKNGSDILDLTKILF